MQFLRYFYIFFSQAFYQAMIQFRNFLNTGSFFGFDTYILRRFLFFCIKKNASGAAIIGNTIWFSYFSPIRESIILYS
ncbi:MAG: hypothetical protein CVU78_01280 [Elusimicrobia bacterium HGW-Elusimicrobia-2]|nr:MAG: hypothetical protein CVU78_01280 [Elusimicrobia bacterium HGW-Elusimicrobia-2]